MREVAKSHQITVYTYHGISCNVKGSVRSKKGSEPMTFIIRNFSAKLIGYGLESGESVYMSYDKGVRQQ